MAIELYWDNDERTVMLCEIRGDWTWEQMYETLGKIKKVTEKATSVIAAIIDISDGASIPGGSILTPAAFDHAKNMLKMGENGTGPMVIVGASPVIKTAYKMFTGMAQGKALSKIAFTDTTDQARAHLTEYYPTRVTA
ncbi:MAG: hypothetical protein IPO91_20930 [Chloroflexi bacterium]|uniref:hypothetical protein n=1 Tax=Candidatus Flexifilum breve TaxID=3140694 RepID=UPI003136E051|nr:hypothetical protein [Chloroflexota bacterium]MBK9749224.1 hypothetical protein [Chloroflexota bacterium]